jgi:IMP cyclohydrolase
MKMYTGRILSTGMNCDGKPFIAYRVSSRSFPNRQCLKFEKRAAIVPKEGSEKDIFDNPYITYNCIRIVDDIAIVSNGSQTDVIADKIELGMSIKDAMAYSLLTMDYEKDDYNTPRIAAAVTSTDNEEEYECYIGIVNDNKILVEQVPYGEAAFISTYGSQVPDKVDFEAKTSEEAAKYIFDEGTFADYEKPVTSSAAVFDGKWTTAVYVP